MKIKHLPNSITPYEDCGYCRIPEKPIAGEEITLGCRLEGNDNGHIIPTVSICVNQAAKEETFTGKAEKSDEKGTYYSFSIGTYRTGDRIRYRFSCQDAKQEASTDWYEFEICRPVIYARPSMLYYDDNSVSLLFTHQENDEFVMELQLLEKEIAVSTRLGRDIPDRQELLGEKKFWRKEDYHLEIEAAPFSLSISDGSGKPLVRWNEGADSITVLYDGAGLIRNMSASFYIKARGLYGFGEKFNRVNQLGLQVKNYVFEHFTHQQEKTYLPVPFFFSDAGVGIFFDTDYPFTVASGQEANGARLTIDAPCRPSSLMDSLKLYFGEPGDMLQKYIDNTGECVLPPKWSFGPWMSANGWNTQKETLEQIDHMKNHQIPASVLVLEAWSDETTFYLFNESSYQPKDGGDALEYGDCGFASEGMWPDPKGMCDILHENNVKLVLWQIPVIKHMENGENLQHRNDEEYAIRMGYCVKDREGRPYRITDKWFSNSLVPDFTNPKAREWWFSKRKYLLTEVGVDGFKTDGGEFIYDNEAVFSNGKSGEEMRNPYPNLYLEAYHEFLKQYKGEGRGVLFSRAGYKGAQRVPIHWAGDQMSEYSEFRAQVKAGLSAGLSGIIFWGFDIAGFAGDLPTTDLFLRSAAMAAFSPVMQFHSEPRSGQFFYEERRSWNNDRSPWNMAEVNKEPRILEVYRRYANLRMNLLPYIYNEAIHCSRKGRPMFAHLLLDYPEDAKVIDMEDQYLFGRSLLVAPVLEEGAVSRTVYLPEGNWYDFFTGRMLEGGREMEVSCPLGEIPVFVKEGHGIALNLADSLALSDYIGNDPGSYRNFAVRLFGEQGKYEFKDDLGHDFVLEWDGGPARIQGHAPENLRILQ